MAEPQKTSQQEADELSRTIDEYRSKVNEIVRREREKFSQIVDEKSNHIINGAWRKAEEIIAQSQQEGQQIREEIENQAKKKAAEIISEANSKAQQIISEIEERAKKEAKNRTKLEAEKIITKAKEEANAIISQTRQAAEKEAGEIIGKSKKEVERIIRDDAEKYLVDAKAQSTQITSEARKRAERVIDDVVASSLETNKILVEAMQKTEAIVHKFKDELQAQLGQSTEVIASARNKLEQIIAENEKKGDNVRVFSDLDEEANQNAVLSVLLNGKEGGGGNGDNHLFRGQMVLKTMSSCDYLQIKKLRNFLTRVPNIKYAGEFTSEKETTISFEIEEPLPLVTILSNVPSVERVVTEGDDFQLILRN